MVIYAGISIRRCPMADVKIQAMKNGPLLVHGEVDILDSSGKPLKSPRPTVALCRCGQSANKPFCDGTHGKINFQG
jgi:CDGSH-type Zn-finger protein